MRPLALLIVTLLGIRGVFAQAAAPRLGYVYPAGGRQGTTFKITVGGQFLEGATNAIFTGQDIRAVVLDYDKPLNQKQINEARERLRELQEKRATIARQNSRKSRRNQGVDTQKLVWTAAEEKELAEIRIKMEAYQRRPSTPAIAESVVLQVTVETNAPPGPRELRLLANLGLSNPLTFRIDTLPESVEPPPAQENYSGRLRAPKLANEQTPIKSGPPIAFSLPAILNGQIFPSEVDRYRFHARQGQNLVAAVSARDLLPYLADAVPGWFQATLAVYDSQGKEMAYDDDFRFRPDPALHLIIPKDGDYTLEIKDALYRGREDFVYRLTVGELPFVTAIFPLGAPSGEIAELDLQGWNLKDTHLKKPGNSTDASVVSLLSEQQTGAINSVPFVQSDDLSELSEQEPNDTFERAQSLPFGIVVNGRISRKGDKDIFQVRGEAGVVLVAEITARRLGSPLDSQLRINGSDGSTLAFNDDFEDKGAGLETHHADSYLRATLPTNGVYYVTLTDSQGQGGPEFAYRLRISQPRPDFELRIVPSSLTLRTRVSQPVTCYALRKDGFTNQINLSLKGGPPGFNLSGAVIPAGQDQVRATLSAPPDAEATVLRLQVEGRARVNGRDLSRLAQPCDDLMQAFFYRHLVPAQELAVLVRNQIFSRETVRLVGEGPMKIPMGGSGKVIFAGTPSGFADRVRLELSDPPAGIQIQKVAMNRGQAEVTISIDASVPAGTSGNLIVNVFPNKGPGANAKNPNAQLKRMALGALPAIAFEVVAP